MQRSTVTSIYIPHKVWLEPCGEGHDACDVIVEMEDKMIYTALFVTFDYLQHQMQLGYEMSGQLVDAPATRYAVLDTPHILVDNLHRETIEDTIDCLLAQDVFEGLFTRVTQEIVQTTGTIDGGRTTQEVAAVVISDVLVVKG